MKASKITLWDLWEVFRMANLLAEGYRRLFKGKRFYIVLAVVIAISVMFTLLYMAVNKLAGGMVMGEEDAPMIPADPLLFDNIGITPLLVGIAAGMLIVQDFRNNTIRNKIIIGHSRVKIYMANWIVSVTVMVIYMIAYLAVSILLGAIILGFEEFPSKAIFINLLHVFFIELAMTSLIVFLCNTMKNVGGFVLAITMHYIVDMFSLSLMLLNKHEKAQQIIREAVPSLQMSIIQQNYTEIHANGVRMILFMVAITVVSTVAGALLFRKSDLK